MEIVENINQGKWNLKLGKMEIIENGNYGKWKFSKIEIVESSFVL